MKKIIFSAAVLTAIMTNAQNTGIGTTKPDASAQLDVSAANKGVLMPRVALTATTAAAPVTAPATGLIVFNTATAGDVTPGYYYWDGAKWAKQISSYDQEWFYNPQNSNIELKRSGTAPFLSKIRYKNNGQFIDSNLDAVVFDANNQITVQNNYNYLFRAVDGSVVPTKQDSYWNQSSKLMSSEYFILKQNDIAERNYLKTESLMVESDVTSATEYLEARSAGVVKKNSAATNSIVSDYKYATLDGNGSIPFWMAGSFSIAEASNGSSGKINTMVGSSNNIYLHDNNNRPIEFATPTSSNFRLGSGSINLSKLNLFDSVLNSDATNASPIGSFAAFNFYGIPSNLTGIVNAYGLKLGSIQGAQNNWSIYTEAGRVSFGDNLQLRSINDAANTSSNTADKVLVADANGNVKTQSASAIATSSEPWFNTATQTGATANSQAIYQSNNVLAGSANSGTIGTVTLAVNQGTPVSNRLEYGTDNSGYKFAIAKNNAGIVTDQLVMQDNGNMGLGITDPIAKLHLRYVQDPEITANQGYANDIVFDNFEPSTNDGLSLVFRRYRGTVAAPADIVDGDRIGGFNFGGYMNGSEMNNGTIGVVHKGVVNGAPKSAMYFSVNEGENYSPSLYLAETLNVGVGTLTPSQKLEVAGNVKASQFISATTTYPDYVFQNYYSGTASKLNPSYKFTSLNETEKFIKENGHLPGFESATEVVKKGEFNVSDTSLKSVEKIEELYLHMIEQQKTIEKLQKRVEELESKK